MCFIWFEYLHICTSSTPEVAAASEKNVTTIVGFRKAAGTLSMLVQTDKPVICWLRQMVPPCKTNQTTSPMAAL